MPKLTGPLEKIDDYRWRIPQTYKKGMRVDGLVFVSEKMVGKLQEEQALEQVANVAFLPGIVGHSLAMPDIHWGYGFPIGGVAAMRLSDGVVSPGGVGFDINCGVRLLRTSLVEEDVRPRIKELVDALYRNVPSGPGSELSGGRGLFPQSIQSRSFWGKSPGRTPGPLPREYPYQGKNQTGRAPPLFCGISRSTPRPRGPLPILS